MDGDLNINRRPRFSDCPFCTCVSSIVPIGCQYQPLGVLAIGQFACGVVTISQFGVGVLSISQFTIAGFALAQFAIAYSLIAQFGILFHQGRGQLVWSLADIIRRLQ